MYVWSTFSCVRFPFLAVFNSRQDALAVSIWPPNQNINTGHVILFSESKPTSCTYKVQSLVQ